MKRKLAAVLSADAVGYSRLMERDESGTLAILKAHLQLMDSLVEKHRGRVVAVHGDNLLAEFDSVVDAVQSAVEIQNELKARNEDLPEESRMPFRIGINLGDVIEEEGNIYGDGVNVATRLESLAEGGGICISRSVHDHVKNKLGVGYQSLGSHSVKNIADPVRVYRVLPEPDAFGKTVGKVWYRLKQWQKMALTITVVLLQVGGGIAVKRYMDPAASLLRDLPLPGAGVVAAAGQAVDRRSSVREHDRRPEAGVFHGRIHGADHHLPVEDLLPVRHLPELVVHLQREAGEGEEGEQGTRGPVRAGGEHPEIRRPGADQRPTDRCDFR